jgi:hypothetical protein
VNLNEHSTMIGVVSAPAHLAVVSEFFELFKTPWEVYEFGRPYDVVLCTGDVQVPHDAARVIVVYSGQQADSLPMHGNGRMLSYQSESIPVYVNCAVFSDQEAGLLTDRESGKAAGYTENSGSTVIARIGYDLFAEVRLLLEQGQPVANAAIPTLELHIAVLRDLIVENGVSLVEIPPVPAGYRFIACLTHDVDHPSLRLHRFDHTSVGFLYRAICGSVVNVIRRRATVRHLLANWGAALKLPFVYLGWARDFWKDFERYPALEAGLPSTFFVIPFQGRPGRGIDGDSAPRERASGYGVADIKDSINSLSAAGCEIGLHGIDAWCDGTKAREEMEQLQRFAPSDTRGVRMHWLYFEQQSADVLDNAGVDYDSTAGYNEAIGYRAGTVQAYKPLTARRLLELPLIIMDTALFFPKRQNLSAEQAHSQVQAILDHAAAFGGCITVNWHDRSISPERNWNGFYTHFIDELKMRGAWFATASEVVAWFRKRRCVLFEAEPSGLSAVDDSGTPELQLRVHSGAGRAQDTPIRAGGFLTAGYATAGQRRF